MELKKSLGQHFLHDQHMLQKIANAIGDVNHYASVLEIGPGHGALTRYMLAKQLPDFKAVEIDKEIAALSHGGRARLLFALFSARNANVLLLDEPTNHLDLEALSALEEAVAHYEGTIILVSHDRYFLKKFAATDTYVVSNGTMRREVSFEAYAKNAEQAARRLIAQL